MAEIQGGSDRNLFTQILLNADSLAFDQNTAATHALFTPAAGERFVVFRLFLHCTGANTITFQSGATNISGAIPFGAGCYISWGESGEQFIFKGRATGEAFNLVLASAAQVTGWANVGTISE